MRVFNLIQCSIVLIAVSFLITSCGINPRDVSDTEQHIRISQTAQSTADTRQVYADLKAIHESADGIGVMPTDQLFSILAMKKSERQRIASSYPHPLQIKCTDGFCTIEGHGQSVSAQTDVSGGGISRPTLVLGTKVKGVFIFTSTDVLRACEMSGVSVQKLFVTKTVQGVEIAVGQNSTGVVVDAGDANDNFNCR